MESGWLDLDAEVKVNWRMLQHEEYVGGRTFQAFIVSFHFNSSFIDCEKMRLGQQANVCFPKFQGKKESFKYFKAVKF